MTPTLTPTEIGATHHARAVRFFWGFLIGATMVSLLGNVVQAIWPLIPFVVIQVGIAAVPPLFLLAVVHGIALRVRAGASGTVYRWAVTARCYRRRRIRAEFSCPARPGDRHRDTTCMGMGTQTSAMQRPAQPRTQGTKAHVTPFDATSARAQTVQAERMQASASVQPRAAQMVQDSAQTEAQVDADLASELIASGVTTQPVETVMRCSRRTVTARRSMLRPKHGGSTTELHSESWQLPVSTGSGSSWRSADAPWT
jgi:hypothetical protein